MGPDWKNKVNVAVRTTKVLKLSDITRRIIELDHLISKEKNRIERARLETDQAALQLTVRLIKHSTAYGKVK